MFWQQSWFWPVCLFFLAALLFGGVIIINRKLRSRAGLLALSSPQREAELPRQPLPASAEEEDVIEEAVSLLRRDGNLLLIQFFPDSELKGEYRMTITGALRARGWNVSSTDWISPPKGEERIRFKLQGRTLHLRALH